MSKFVPLLALSACSAASVIWTNMPRPEQISALDKIADECLVPRKAFDLKPNGELHIKFDPSEKFERADCAIRKLTELKVEKMGFIGNKAYGSEF